MRAFVELASPGLLIPPLPGWRERSEYITAAGSVVFRHFDYYSQALAKIERGHQLDLNDAAAFISAGLVDAEELRRLAEAAAAELVRYPAVNSADFIGKVDRFLAEREGEPR